MLSQTVDQLIPLLSLLQQPAFCIREDGSVYANQPAVHLAPAGRLQLPNWLGDNAPIYALWDRQSGLELPMSLAGHDFSVSVRPLADGELFLLSDCDGPDRLGRFLSSAAQVMRQPLTDLFSLSQRLFAQLEEAENPAMQQQTAAISKNLYRLARISGNLADLSQMSNGTYRIRARRLELSEFLASKAAEWQDACRDAGVTLECKPFKTQVWFFADPDLLERAVLNLISNAVKFGVEGQPVQFWAETHGNAILLRVRSRCSASDCELLSAAFSRLERRGVLPDSRWGLGLGLPLVRYIAQLHGGAVALEANRQHVVTVTMSIAHRQKSRDAVLESPPPMDYSGGLCRTLVELSDILPTGSYDSTAI